MNKAHKLSALVLALLLGAPMLDVVIAAPASAGNWTASTPDDGNGNSVSAEGTSTDTVNPDGSVTTCTQSTTTWTSLKTGQVVKTTVRKRCVTKKAKQVLKLASAEATTINNADGTSDVIANDQTVNGNTSGSVDTNQHFSAPNGQGDVLGGDSTRSNFDGSKTTKEHDRWDPASGTWVAVNDPPAHHARLLLPILAGALLIFGVTHHSSDNVSPQNDTPQQPRTEPNR
ncbi:MAG: hypothetical protein JO219_03005 [Candidatus Eremiobacteraeota bacterium]|nr:hypothetical protein [Candidatus Eremiobacteraeota bacterium]MBV8364878.1 hypothetical protein [Candidatus Eremiobacteraeota bacterium]